MSRQHDRFRCWPAAKPRLVGATTLDEYRKHIEKTALERRFQQVYVGELSVETTIGILRGLKDRYSEVHHARITDFGAWWQLPLERPVYRPLPARQGHRPVDAAKAGCGWRRLAPVETTRSSCWCAG